MNRADKYSQDENGGKGSAAKRAGFLGGDDLDIFDEDAENRGDEVAPRPGDDLVSIEKDILRYYYYIHNGIDTEHVAPLENVRIHDTLGTKPLAAQISGRVGLFEVKL